MKPKFKEIVVQLGYQVNITLLEEQLEDIMDAVVQECVNVVHARYMGDNNREDMEVRRCVETLQTHFGVE